MKTKNILFCGLLLLPSASQATDWKAITVDVLQFSAGVITAFALHEAGHAVAARVYHEDLEWNGRGFSVEWTCLAPCKRLDSIALAGNLTTAIVGETLLHLPYKGAFVDGIQAFNAVNPIGYAIRDSVTSGGYGDYRHVDDRIQFALAIHGASIGYRQFSERLWGMSVERNRIQLSFRF